MNRSCFALFLLLTSAWLGAVGHPARAAQLVALAPEEELYADIFSDPPSVAAQPGGPYVIAWADDIYDNNEELFTYRYTPAGQDPAGIDSETDYQTDYHSIYSSTGPPSVDAVTAGRQGFDVLWHTSPEDKPTLFYQTHLNLRGMREGKTVLLGGKGTEWVWQVRGSGFMAGWSLPSKHGIAARRLTATGQRTGPELRLNSRLIDSPTNVSVVGLADASFVAVWIGVVPGSSGTLVLRARRFSPSGKPLGPDFDVNTSPLGVQDPAVYYPEIKVAAAPGGGFVVAWAVHQGVFLRWFNASGIPLGPEHRASASEDSDSLPQSMAFDDTGNLLLLFNPADDSLQLQLFDPQGTPQGPPVYVNSDFNDDPWGRSDPVGGDLAWTGDSWLVTWLAAIFPYDQSSIFARRFVKK